MENLREMPWDKEAETAILGAIIQNHKMLFVAQANMRTEDLYLESHRKIYSAMVRVQATGMSIDAITLRNELSKSNDLDRSGGFGYLVSLSSGIPDSLNIESYARIVKEQSRLRQAIQACNSLSEQCYRAEDPFSEIIGDYQSKIRSICNSTGDGFHTGADAISDTFKFIEERKKDPRKVTGVPCGINAMDNLTTGFQPGDLIVISARTGLGKTALALNSVCHAMLRDGKKVLIFSLEMSRKQLGIRMISMESGIDGHKLATGYFKKEDWPLIAEASSRLTNCKLWIYDKSISLTELDSRVRRTHDENNGLDLVVVDYLQLVTAGGSNRRVENRTQEVTEVSRGLKSIATDLNIPVIALSQLNGDGEVRESRAIEHDASLMILIEMDKEKLKTINPVPAQLIINKNRNGSLSTVDAMFYKDITKFSTE